MKSVLVIGMGEFGKHLAKKLLLLKNDVCIVDQNADLINLLSNDFENAYIGDCMQKVTLKELGAKNFDICVVSIGSNFQASLEITSNLKELGAKYIISKAHSELQSKFLLMAGANEAIYPEKEFADKLAVRCNANNMFDYIQLSDKYSIIEIGVPREWVSHSIKGLNIRNKYDINIIAIKNQNQITIPTADYIFLRSDHIIVFGDTKSIKSIHK